eukprot:7212330-Prymnesium_polylepis.2
MLSESYAAIAVSTSTCVRRPAPLYIAASARRWALWAGLVSTPTAHTDVYQQPPTSFELFVGHSGRAAL